jgi:hypothetical protein
MNGSNDSMVKELLDAASNREAPAQKARSIILQARIADRPGVSEAKRAEIDAHNADCDRGAAMCNDHLNHLTIVIESSQDDSCAMDVYSALEEVSANHPILAQQAARLCARARELSEAMLTELEGRPRELEVEASKVVEKVKSQLTKIGCGLDAQVGWLHGSSSAAERQFDYLARHGNIHSRAALAAVADARSQLTAIQESIGRYNRLLLEAKALITRLAKKAILG